MREREPLNWSMALPWKVLGVTVHIHILFPCVASGVILWVATSRDFAPGLWLQACTVLALLFACVFLHEMGHVIGARRVDGDALEVQLWPLGGLAPVDVPHSPRALFWATAYGPAVNLALAAGAGAALLVLGFVPPWNPLASPLNPRLYQWREGLTYFSFANRGQSETWYYRDLDAKQTQRVNITFDQDEDGQWHHRSSPTVALPDPRDKTQVVLANARTPLEAARVSGWTLLLAQFFAVNWLLLWVNLLPAFPLDGGRLFQCWLWRRGDWRQATATASYAGFLVMLAVGVYAIAVNDILPAGLAAVIYLQSRQQLIQLERTEEESSTTLGYDFSQGFTSLERGEEAEARAPARPAAKSNWLRRWLQRRAGERRAREAQQREADERRLDELLEKIHRAGRQALTEEEWRFLNRFSSKYPNRK